MAEILYAIQFKHPECKTFKRSYDSLIREWKAHNRLYKGGIERSHTKDVDLDYPSKGYYEVIYGILAI